MAQGLQWFYFLIKLSIYQPWWLDFCWALVWCNFQITINRLFLKVTKHWNMKSCNLIILYNVREPICNWVQDHVFRFFKRKCAINLVIFSGSKFWTHFCSKFILRVMWKLILSIYSESKFRSFGQAEDIQRKLWKGIPGSYRGILQNTSCCLPTGEWSTELYEICE